jgi:hypothetical protein
MNIGLEPGGFEPTAALWRLVSFHRTEPRGRRVGASRLRKLPAIARL